MRAKDKVKGQRRGTDYRCGFTLIELIVVMAIIAILAGLTMPALRTARLRARVAKAQSMIASLGMALSMYETDFGTFPPGAGTDNRDLVDRLADSDVHGSGLNPNWKGPYIEFREDDIEGIVVGGDASLLDPWGSQYFYSLTAPPGAPAGLSFWIYSYGPDRENDDGQESGGTLPDLYDDINNW